MNANPYPYWSTAFFNYELMMRDGSLPEDFPLCNPSIFTYMTNTSTILGPLFISRVRSQSPNY